MLSNKNARNRLAKSREIIYFLTNNYAIYWKDQELVSSFWFKMSNIGAKVAAESRASKSPIVNISYYNIFGSDQKTNFRSAGMWLLK